MAIETVVLEKALCKVLEVATDGLSGQVGVRSLGRGAEQEEDDESSAAYDSWDEPIALTERRAAAPAVARAAPVEAMVAARVAVRWSAT